jgi:pseudouridylate synthase
MEERDERMARRFREGRQQQEQLTVFDPTQEMRLNRYIAHCGACSRRDADLMIERGEVTVNGEVVTTLGTRVIPAEAEVICRGKKLEPERKVYVLLNKPKDCFCTNDDEHAEGHTVLDLLGGAVSERIYPVGRLDRNSTGLLLLTNDGELTEQLTHPSHEKRKIYEVELDNPLRPEDMQLLLDGVEIEGEGTVKMDAVEYVRPESRAYVGVEIHTGQNRIVRRLFDALGYEVKKLDRVYYAGLTKKDLPRGEWRYLSDAEVIMLKTGRYE